jgi:hypothetical protein
MDQELVDQMNAYLAATESSLPSTEWTKIAATSRYSDCASVLMLRRKNGETWAYHFVWQKQDGKWQVLREFTLHEQFRNLPG